MHVDVPFLRPELLGHISRRHALDRREPERLPGIRFDSLTYGLTSRMDSLVPPHLRGQPLHQILDGRVVGGWHVGELILNPRVAAAANAQAPNPLAVDVRDRSLDHDAE